MMRSHLLGRAFLACWCALAAYCLLSILLGPAGVVAYRELEGRVALMRGNIEGLRRSNEGLSSEFQSLRSDPDRAIREARALGYLGPGETALVLGDLAGGGGPGARAADVPRGSIVRYEPMSPLGDLAIKEIAMALGILVFVLGMASDLSRQAATKPGRLHASSRT